MHSLRPNHFSTNSGFLRLDTSLFQSSKGKRGPLTSIGTRSFFDGRTLRDKRVLVYQHSAVGRDLLVEILEHFGVEVVKAGRSDTFAPIDTENIDDSTLAVIQELVDRAVAAHGPLYAVLSTDGDSDTPLILELDQESSRVHFFGGDLLGILAAEFLRADAVVVPIGCNDAVDHCELQPLSKQKLGSARHS
jgi:phosphomannomutase